MYTRWGKCIASIYDATGKPGFIFNPSSYVATGVAKDLDGTDRYIAPKYAGSISEDYQQNLANESGVMLGTGTTPATEDDYRLESRITSGITVSKGSVGYSYDNINNRYCSYYNYTISNTGSSAITIGEIGRYVKAYYGTALGETIPTSSSSNKANFLVDRTVLDEPVVIPAGESGVVRYQTCYNADFSKPV